eukprot:NODE_53_length_26956_cov_0.387348.p16 type:complete len:112 gc:universal NODE_53_length_26956_cov_0.387348:9093-9428(+)
MIYSIFSLFLLLLTALSRDSILSKQFTFGRVTTLVTLVKLVRDGINDALRSVSCEYTGSCGEIPPNELKLNSVCLETSPNIFVVADLSEVLPCCNSSPLTDTVSMFTKYSS